MALISPSVPAFRIRSCVPSRAPASCTSRMMRAAIGLFGLTQQGDHGGLGNQLEPLGHQLG